MKRTILSLSLVLAFALFASVAAADDATDQKPDKPAATEKSADPAPEPAEKPTPAQPKPAAELSVKPQETETELPLEDKESDPTDAASAPTGFVNSIKDKVKEGFGRDPILWGIVGLVLTFLGYRGTKGAMTHASAVTSKGEVFGMTLISGGFLGFTNGVARAFDWSQLNLTLIVGGILIAVLGIGFTTQANEERQKARKKAEAEEEGR